MKLPKNDNFFKTQNWFLYQPKYFLCEKVKLLEIFSINCCSSEMVNSGSPVIELSEGEGGVKAGTGTGGTGCL